MTPGRPRDRRVDAAVISATRELLLENTLANLTVEAVAARAGVGKAAIYRRYSSKMHLVFAATIHGAEIEAPGDSGSLHGDLVALLSEIAASLANPVARQVVPALLMEMSADAEVAAGLTQSYVAREHEVIGEVLRRAVARGDLPAAPPVALAQCLLVGPVFAWIHVLRHDVDASDIETLATMLVGALQQHAAAADLAEERHASR
ncbi:MAG TPA: TetR/AcrR family transcriptional regulator [Cryptosporangiaceae bacterium]|nr:TetR/AcrR family transcriptional regulator [Cryptosporangiaceae bacterium]